MVGKWGVSRNGRKNLQLLHEVQTIECPIIDMVDSVLV